MKVIAHRGACREFLENSWQAFNQAVAIGADRIEFDIVLTKDGQPMIMHDNELIRTTGIAAKADQMTRAEAGKIKLTNGEAIPFLDDVVAELLPKIELNIEIKGESTELAARAAEIVMAKGHLDKVIFSSFNLAPLAYLAEHHPDLQLACLVGPIVLWPYFGHKAPSVFMMQTRARIVHPWTGWVTAGFMDQAKARQWTVYPYCEMNGEENNREGLWTNLKTLGVDGLCTNYPREFKAWLESVENHGTANPQT